MLQRRLEVEQMLVFISNMSHCLIGKDECDKMAAFYSCSFASVSIMFFILIRTPIF